MVREIKLIRFDNFSDAVVIKKLEKEKHKLFFTGVLVTVSLCTAAGSYFMFKRTEVQIMIQPSVEYIINQPRKTKPIEIRKNLKAKRTVCGKEIIHRKTNRKIKTSLPLPLKFPLSVVIPDYEIEINDNWSGSEYPLIKIPIKKIHKRRFLMKEELLSLDDFDYGRYKSMVLQNPHNKQDVTGFIYIGTTWGAQLQLPDNMKRAVLNLVEAVNRYTHITANVDTHIFLDTSRLFEMPFIYITTDGGFELTKIERKNLGAYLKNGGFAVLDNGCPGYTFSPAEASLNQMLRDALGAHARFTPIPNNHPIYHCFFDFDDGPPQGSEIKFITTETPSGSAGETRRFQMSEPVYFLEGIWLDNRLAAIYSNKGYSQKWKGIGVNANNEPQLKMGINMVVYALTHEGGIAQKNMSQYLTAE